jgi:hypothetical protein
MAQTPVPHSYRVREPRILARLHGRLGQPVGFLQS